MHFFSSKETKENSVKHFHPTCASIFAFACVLQHVQKKGGTKESRRHYIDGVHETVEC
jgi:hypothetical protein